MSSKQWVEWVHGKKDAEEEKPAPKKKSKPKVLTADKLGAGAKSRKQPVEPSPSEPED